MQLRICVLVVLVGCAVVNIDALRRGSFGGKRIPKAKPRGGGGSGGGSSSTSNVTTSDPETESKLAESTTTVDNLEDELAQDSFDHDFKCQGTDIKLSEQQIKDLKECGDLVGVASKSDLTIDKVPCFAKCVLERKKLVDDVGKPHKENILAFFSNSMPEAAVEPLKAASNKCIDLHAGMVDPKDESCHTYTPLALCMHLALADICKFKVEM